MEYYLAPKRKDALTPATTWVNLEDIIVSEISQTHSTNMYGSTYVKDS